MSVHSWALRKERVHRCVDWFQPVLGELTTCDSGKTFGLSDSVTAWWTLGPVVCAGYLLSIEHGEVACLWLFTSIMYAVTLEECALWLATGGLLDTHMCVCKGMLMKNLL